MLSMKTSFTPCFAASRYAPAVATGSVGIETMMSGCFARTVSMSETCFSGLKFASVTARTSMPRLSSSARSPSTCALDQSLPP
jgi:hypothetical protein